MDKSFLADTKLAHLVKLGMDTTMGVFEAVFKFAIFLIVYFVSAIPGLLWLAGIMLEVCLITLPSASLSTATE